MTVIEMRKNRNKPMAGTREWFEKRLEEILLSEPICQATERDLIKCEIGREVYTLSQCWENYYYLTAGDLYKDLFEILLIKNADYSGGDDVFSNLRLCESIGIEPEVGIKVRMCDKVSRIRNLVNKDPEVVEESLADSWLDLAGYLVLDYLYDDYLIILDKITEELVGQCQDPQNEN